MEDILASIKKVIAEDKDLRTAPIAPAPNGEDDEDEEEQEERAEAVLELDDPLCPEGVDLGPPLLDEPAADASRHSFDQLRTVAASAPPPASAANPLEEVVREMLRPILKQWIDDHLPAMVDEHVKREISRITGRPL